MSVWYVYVCVHRKRKRIKQDLKNLKEEYMGTVCTIFPTVIEIYNLRQN